jgi:hypothetical protein
VRQRTVVLMASLALMMSWACGRGSEPKAPTLEALDPAEILRQMSSTIAGAHQLSFRAHRDLDAALVAGSAVAESADIEVAVSRPRMLQAKAVSSAGVRRFYTDGQSVSLLDETMNLYATVPLAGTIDEIVGRLEEQYGFTPPLVEFVLNDPYQKFNTQIKGSVNRGKETVSGVECDRLALVGEIADADLWIGRADHLPRRLVATFKDREGSPQLKVEFSEWNLAATLEETSFVFAPPKDAAKITMVIDDGQVEPSLVDERREKAK